MIVSTSRGGAGDFCEKVMTMRSVHAKVAMAYFGPFWPHFFRYDLQTCFAYHLD